MARAAKVDANQKEIVGALRSIGASVQHLHGVAEGCPDIVVGYKRVNYLLEIKDGNKPLSQQRLTPYQVRWHELWQGSVHVVSSVEEALRVVQGGMIYDC